MRWERKGEEKEGEGEKGEVQEGETRGDCERGGERGRGGEGGWRRVQQRRSYEQKKEKNIGKKKTQCYSNI